MPTVIRRSSYGKDAENDRVFSSYVVLNALHGFRWIFCGAAKSESETLQTEK